MNIICILTNRHKPSRVHGYHDAPEFDAVCLRKGCNFQWESYEEWEARRNAAIRKGEL